MSEDNCYRLVRPFLHQVPILVSAPHSGVEFPMEVAGDFHPQVVEHPEDTDWFVDRLYEFVTELGLPLIVAKYSRYVIDLNRGLDSQPSLYPGRRGQTSLVPTESFRGEALYRRQTPGEREIQRRVRLYYTPYYERVSSLLEELRATFGQALFFDAHSIKHQVPSLREEPFSDLTLSDFNGHCSHPHLAQRALDCLQGGPYKVSYNSFFLGGQLVRTMAQPDKKIYGLQLEMCQNIYMDEEGTQYGPERASQVQGLLRQMFLSLIQAMQSPLS